MNKNKLITALRIAANALENGTFPYSWIWPAQCNCGVLFCALTGKTPSQLKAALPLASKYEWATIVAENCPITGVPQDKLMRELLSYGLTPVDIASLETLSDQRVLARMGNPTHTVEIEGRWWWSRTKRETRAGLKKDHQQHAIKYMRTWADLLAEENKIDQVDQEKVT